MPSPQYQRNQAPKRALKAPWTLRFLLPPRTPIGRLLGHKTPERKSSFPLTDARSVSEGLLSMLVFGLGGLLLILLGISLGIVYGVLYFCTPFILYAIMKNTKQIADLLAQMKSFQQTSPGSASTKNLAPPALPTRTLGSFLVEKPASASSNKLHKEAAGEPPKFTTQKWGSTYNETDEKRDP